MRLMIRCDVEGVTGVVHPSQAAPTGAYYAYGVEMLHHDVNAVIDGIFATGDHEVWVYDMHYFGFNLDMARLDPRVRIVCGKPHYGPGNVGGLTAGFDGQIIIGLHAKSGAGTLLAHSYEHEIEDMVLNGVSVGEIGLEAAMAGELGVPTLLVTADSAGCDEAKALLGDALPTVKVKESLGPYAAVCYPTAATGPLLRAGGEAAIAAADNMAPYRVPPPINLSIKLQDGAFADHVRAQLASFVTSDGTIQLTADSVVDAWQLYLHAKPAA